MNKTAKETIFHVLLRYSKLILFVGPAGSGKTQVLQDISVEYGKTLLNINLEMSKALMEIPILQRESRSGRIFDRSKKYVNQFN